MVALLIIIGFVVLLALLPKRNQRGEEQEFNPADVNHFSLRASRFADDDD